MLTEFIRPARTVFPLLLSTLLMVSGVALGILLMPLRADMEGWSAGTIGLIASSYSLAFTLGCIFVPRLIRQFGHVPVFAAMLTLSACGLVAIALFVHPVSWLIARSVTGFATASCYTIIEAWLNERSENSTRGLVFSWYMLACLFATIAGQYALPLSSPADITLFVAAALCFFAAILPTALSGMKRPEAVQTIRLDFRGLLRNSPAAIAGNIVTGMLFGSWSSFAALYASTSGFSNTAIATLLMCASLGGLVFQFPVGRISDRVDRRLVMAALGALGLSISVPAALFLPAGGLVLGILYFLFGATLHPGYALNVAHANDHARPGGYVGISGAMMVVFGLGAMSGPFVAGLVIDRFGYGAFFAWLAAGYLVYLVYPLWRMTRRAPPPRGGPDSADVNPAGLPRP
jgi:MFS family permease